MDLLFAGLIALGVAITVVILLKCLCFLGEFVHSQRSQGVESSREASRNGGPASTNSAMAQQSSSSNEQNRGCADCVMIRVDRHCPNGNKQPPQCGSPSACSHHDPPPSYEEALRLINDPVPPADSRTSRCQSNKWYITKRKCFVIFLKTQQCVRVCCIYKAACYIKLISILYSFRFSALLFQIFLETSYEWNLWCWLLFIWPRKNNSLSLRKFFSVVDMFHYGMTYEGTSRNNIQCKYIVMCNIQRDSSAMLHY